MTNRITLQAVKELLTTYNPRFATANYALVEHWINEGSDLEHDILPTIRTWIARKPDIYALGFFTPYVRKARESRARPPMLSDQEKARRMAWCRERGIHTTWTDFGWLARFEAKNGPVTP